MNVRRLGTLRPLRASGRSLFHRRLRRLVREVGRLWTAVRQYEASAVRLAETLRRMNQVAGAPKT